MSIPLPSALERAAVTWTLGHAGTTGPLKAARGFVRFEASAIAVAYSDRTVLPSPVETPFVAGVMTPVDLIVNDPDIWNWKVTVKAGGVTWDPFHVNVPAGGTNLASASITPGKGPVKVLKGDQGIQGIQGERGPEGPYGGTEVTDPQVASYITDQTETRAALGTVIGAGLASEKRILDGSRLLTVGDSISWPGTPGAQGHTWLTIAEYGSDARLHLYASTAVSGSASLQQLSAVRSLISAGGVLPTMATVLVGANDLGGSGNHEAAFPGWTANVSAIALELRAAGIEPVLCTIVPRSGPATPQPPAVIDGTWNAWLRSFAVEHGFLLADLWRAVADPVTGEWPDGWADPADGVHPLAPGHQAMGRELQRVVYPRLMDTPWIPRVRRLGDANLLPDGIITSASAPTGWLTPIGEGFSYEPDPDAPGLYAAQIAAEDPAVPPEFRCRTLSSSGAWEPGDKITVVVRWRVEDAVNVGPGRGARLIMEHYNGAIRQRTDEIFYGQRIPTPGYQTAVFNTTIAPTTADLRLQFHYSKGSNAPAGNAIVLRLGAWGIYNRSRGRWSTV